MGLCIKSNQVREVGGGLSRRSANKKKRKKRFRGVEIVVGEGWSGPKEVRELGKSPQHLVILEEVVG